MTILTRTISEVEDLYSVDQNYWVQFIPVATKRLSRKFIESLTPRERTLIHIHYITKIFSKDAPLIHSFQRKSLHNYRLLLQKLESKDLLIHLPENVFTIREGVEILVDEILKYGFNVHFETPYFVKFKDVGLTLLQNIIARLFEVVPEKYHKQIFIVPDTAHLYANEITDILGFIKMYQSKIRFIHLNGNSQKAHRMDNHCPIFADNNLVELDLKLLFDVFPDIIYIVELRYYNVEDWKKFAEKYQLDLVPFNVNEG